MKNRQLFVALLLLGSLVSVSSFNTALTKENSSLRLTTRVDPTYTESLWQFTSGFGLGLYDYLVEVFRCLKQLVIHPLASLETFIDAVYHYDETYDLVVTTINEILSIYPHQSIVEKARLQALVFSEIICIFTPTTLPFAWTERALARVRKASAFKRFDPVSAAEWFASEGQPSTH